MYPSDALVTLGPVELEFVAEVARSLALARAEPLFALWAHALAVRALLMMSSVPELLTIYCVVC